MKGRTSHDRAQTLTKFILGHAVEVIMDMDPLYVRVRVGPHVFEDPRNAYPSEKLLANVALAVYAGEEFSPADFDIGDLPDEDVHAIIAHGRAPHRLSATYAGERIP